VGTVIVYVVYVQEAMCTSDLDCGDIWGVEWELSPGVGRDLIVDQDDRACDLGMVTVPRWVEGGPVGA